MPGPAAALPPMDTASRLERMHGAMAEADCGALLISNLVNIRWLTSFTGSRALLVVAEAGSTLITDARYGAQAEAELDSAGVVVDVAITLDDGAAVAAAVAGADRVGLEADDITWNHQRQIDETWLPACEVVPTTGLVAKLRRRKDAGELARIEAAAGIADEAVASVAPLLLDGREEREIALQLDSTMRALGATGPAFETIVAAGPNAALPHVRPTTRVIEVADLVIVDVGAVVDGYHSDMTRTWSCGEADDFQEEIWQTVVAAQEQGVAAVGPGVPAKTIDAACREVIGAAGWGESFIHGTGHGVGLEIHEEPWLGARTEGPLEVGDVITVEPGIYVPGRAGVRIEDTVVVTEAGCRRVTATPKRLDLP